MYIYEALCDVSPSLRALGAKEPLKYSDKPYDIFQEKEANQDQEAVAFMEAFMVEANKKFESDGGDMSG